MTVFTSRAHTTTVIRRFILGAFSALVAAPFLQIAPALAYHPVNNYGERGYVWAASYDDFFIINVSSNDCKPAELDAYAKIKNSTAGTTRFANRWPSGIRFQRDATDPCNGNITRYIDVNLYYSDWSQTHPGETHGGENHSDKAPKSWCDIWNKNHPCGSHTSRVHINQGKWVNTSTAGKERLLMHETGHSLGLSEHCSSDAIMNDGSPGCNGGKWTSIMSYQPTDRDGIHSMYPCWKCP